MAVSDSEALLYDCPLCHQLAGVMCVYAPVAMADPHSRSVAQQQRLSKVGTLTSKVHNERRRVVYEMQRLVHQRQLDEKQHKQRYLTARKALALWDAQENIMLRAWLHQFGSVLWE
jgi:hypothetical protein